MHKQGESDFHYLNIMSHAVKAKESRHVGCPAYYKELGFLHTCYYSLKVREYGYLRYVVNRREFSDSTCRYLNFVDDADIGVLLHRK